MAQNTEKSEPKRPRQGRSPSYPSIPLSEALKKAKAQYEAEGKYAVPVPSAFKSWGYSDKSSGGRDVRASLRYFGLISVDGDGDSAKVKLTEDALRVLLDEREDQTEKQAIIRRLALNPAAHKKLYAKFPDGIKSVATAKHYLQFEEQFNPSAAEALIAEYVATSDFAGLNGPAMVEDIETDQSDKDDQQALDPAANKKGADPERGGQPTSTQQQVKVMPTERIVFTEEGAPSQYLKLIASGEVDDGLLEALEDFVKRQRKRLKVAADDSKPN